MRTQRETNKTTKTPPKQNELSLTPFYLKINRGIRDCASAASVHEHLYNLSYSLMSGHILPYNSVGGSLGELNH